MRTNTNRTNDVYILALNQDNQNNEVALIENYGLKLLTELNGCYKGQTEDSYLVSGDLKDVLCLARQCNQESILILRPDQSAVLLYCLTEIPIELGRFVNIDSHTAKQNDYYTFNPHTNKYYITL